MEEKEIPAVIGKIREQFGEGSIQLIGESLNLDVEVIPTGSFALNKALGVGGVPRGRITEIFGPEGSGKTTLSQHLVANAQEQGLLCAYVDMEHALDLGYVGRTGVNVEELYISQPDTGEQALEIVESLVRSQEFGLVVVDSVAALVPHKEVNESDMGDSVMGLQARLMSQAMRKLTGAIKKSNTAVVFTNQLRQKIGVMFGNPETTPGGMALKFYAAVRIDLRRRELLKSGQTIIGSKIRAKVVKNKVGAPFQEAEFEIRFNEGISIYGEVLTYGVETGVIEQKGAFYYYGEEKLGQGKETAKMTLRDNEPLFEEIYAEVWKTLDEKKE